MKLNNQPSNELHIALKALGYLRTHWWLVLLEIAAILGFNLHTYYNIPAVYQSEASILIDHSQRRLYRRYVLGSKDANSRKQNLVHLLTSHDSLKRFRTALIEHFNTEGRPAYLRNFFPNGEALGPEEFRRNITLGWDSNSDTYNLYCTSHTPEASHDLCLVYMDTVQNYYPEVGQRDAYMEREYLARQIATQIREISERESALVEFQRQNSEFIDFALTSGKDENRAGLRKRVNSLRKETEANRELKDLLLNVPQAKRGEHGALRKSIESLNREISNIQYQIQLTEQSTDPERHSILLDLNQKLAKTSARLAKLNDDEINIYLKNPLDSTEVRVRVTKLEFDYRFKLIETKSAEQELREAEEKTKKYQRLFLEYERLGSDIGQRKKLLIELYKKEQQSEIELSVGQAEVFRLREPSQAPFKTGPFISKYLYTSLSITLFATVITIFLLMALFPRIDGEAEANRLNLPVLGKVPIIRRQGLNSEELPSFGLEHLKIMNYRIIRETKNIKCPIVVISSPNAREGKSTVSHCLGIASQNPNRKTLFIDGDLITTRANKFLGIQEDQTPGLKGLLMAEREYEISDLAIKTIVEGLSYLPRGGRLDTNSLPQHMLPFENMLKKVKEEYDLVLIDTPPLFASNLTHQWSGLAHLIILVARIYLSKPKDIIESIQTCKIFSKSPVGVVLNCVPMSIVNRRASNYYFSRKKVSSSKLAA